MDLETLVIRLEDKMDRQHKDTNTKLDNFLALHHKIDKKVQKNSTYIKVITRLGVTIGTASLGLLIWYVKQGV